MLPLRLKYFPIVETVITLLVICLPLSSSTVLINGIQTAKSFNFFYGMLALAGIASIGFLFKSGRLKLNITAIDVLLLVFVVWLTIDKYFLQCIHSFSLRYLELLGLVVLYIIVRTLNTKYTLYLLLAMCISGAVQAVYGNLQLWGHCPSHHGLFKMTGSFFNPGPYAGYLCCVLPVAVGLYWSFENSRFQVSGFKLRLSLLNRQLGTWNLKRSKAQIGEAQPESERSGDRRSQTWNLELVIIKYVALITIITILLVLPAARSRAAWLGAIAGVTYLAWHKYNLIFLLKSFINGREKSALGNQRSALANLGVNVVGVKVRKLALILLSTLFIVAVSLSLYHYKKDSADGRMLIWTVTANIIKDYPLLGVGQDMFKAHYMNYQAEYFRNNPGSKYETVADDNQYAFNEPLNVWAENGLIGLLLVGGIVFAVFFTPLKDFRFQVSSSKLSSEQNDSKFQVSSSKLSTGQPETCNLNRSEVEIGVAKPETCNLRPETCNLQPETCNLKPVTCNLKPVTCNLQPATILKASILSILVFGLFAYPSEILPIKIVAITCLGLLANYFASNTSNRESESNSETKPESERSVDRRSQTWNLKPVIIAFAFTLVIFTYPKISVWKSAHTTWKNAMDLYSYGLYEQSVSEYEKAYPVLKINGEFLINYGKALSIVEKHAQAVSILEQAKSHQSNTVLYTALGDSHKALEEYEVAEQCYSQAANMASGKFFPLYLLAKLYFLSGQQHKAIEIANDILNKEVKVHSMAIEEIKAEMRIITEL